MPFPMSLRERRRRPEVMDQPGLDPDAHRLALDALRRVNRLSTSLGALWPPIRELCRERREAGGPPIRVLDLATGGGDLPVQLGRRAASEGLAIEVSGCDRSPLALDYARDHARAQGVPATFFERDVIVDGPPEGYDVLTSSLFLHHLDEPEALAFLAAAGRAAGLVLIDDLNRSAMGWALAYAGLRLLSRSKVAHEDGPISVEGAFTRDEARDLARRAGWADVEVRSHWPCRYLLIGRRR